MLSHIRIIYILIIEGTTDIIRRHSAMICDIISYDRDNMVLISYVCVKIFYGHHILGTCILVFLCVCVYRCNGTHFI